MNHLGDTNKMVGDTPRTDAGLEYDDTTVDDVKDFARQLERELNAANDRIKRLEEAGDALKAAGYFGGFNDAVDKWIKVKEAKL